MKNVTPMKPYQGKPGQWIDGGTHGNEYTGTEVCLYIIDKLLAGYGSDPGITRLVDQNTFYMCPIVNPDGVFNSVEAGISQRANSAAEDNDKDGKVNEDGPDDLNGDGVITQFRYKDPNGNYTLSDADPRVMVRLTGTQTAKTRYSVVTEDRDNDGDGRRGEDSQSGIDVNRNFPEGWYTDDVAQGGTGTYPTSSPEAHAVVEFFTNHTNILLVQSFHTSGGFTYRPYARWPDSRIDAKDLAVFDRVIGRKHLELIGEPAAPQKPTTSEPGGLVQARRPGAPAVDQAGQARRPAADTPAPAQPRGWRHPYNDERRTPYGYGVFLDWAYGQFGSYAMSTELWNWQKDTKGLAGYAGEADRVKWEVAFINYQEKAFGGKAFLPWKAFKHSELGEGEIGGWVSKYGSGNAIPGESLLGVCETHWQFERFKATLLPRLEITTATARLLYTTNNVSKAAAAQQGDAVTIRKGPGGGKYRVVEVTATIANGGTLATQIATGARLRGNREDVVWLLGDRDKVRYLEGSAWVRLGVIDGAPIPGYQPGPAPSTPPSGRGGGGGGFGAPQIPTMPGVPAQVREQRPEPSATQAGTTRTVTWLVAVDGDTPLKVVVTSQKGGTVVKDVVIEQSTRSTSW